MTQKPQLLDLWIDDRELREIVKEKLVEFAEIRQWRNFIDYLRIIMKDFAEERIKSACDFYLMYKDNPELLIEEYPKYRKKVDSFYETETELFPYETNRCVFLNEKYNEWLFKLAFKGVLK